jgi:hypothetical protein
MSSTFEQLSDEILMIIFQYSGNVYIILKTFLSLNQRLNNILMNQRLHLFTDFLHINVRNDYYNSETFQQVFQRLSSINTTIDEKNLSGLLQPLVSFRIQQKYIQLGHEVQSSVAKFKAIRQQLSGDEIMEVDQELKTQCERVMYTWMTVEDFKYIESLVLVKGACSVCDCSESHQLNLIVFLNQTLLLYINKPYLAGSIGCNSFLQLFKTLIISNISSIKNRDYVSHSYWNLQYILMYAFYELEKVDSRYSSSIFLNMKCYRAIVDLYLFVLQAWNIKHLLKK